ncbi:hypothetical protein EZS27_037243, partial [termite gut metagenome]
VKVKGSIDGFEFKNYHLLPTVKGNGRLFLAIKAEIRKAIKKQQVILFTLFYILIMNR